MQTAGDREEQQENGGSDEQGDEKDGNLPIENTDNGSGAGEDDESGGGEQDQQVAGQRGTLPDELSEGDTAASQAVEQFDQMGAGTDEEDPDAPEGGLPDEDAIPGTGISMTMMEQWLEQIEGDPAYLLRNQFLIRERQELEQHGRVLRETRPW